MVVPNLKRKSLVVVVLHLMGGYCNGTDHTYDHRWFYDMTKEGGARREHD